MAMITGEVLLDEDAAVAGITVGPRGALVFSPEASVRARSTGNVVVEGRLVLAPANGEVEHVLAFDNVEEADVVGGHASSPLPQDVGVWVVGGGVIEWEGTEKLSWTRVEGSPRAGDTVVHLVEVPTGWRVGDEVVIVPSERSSSKAYDQRTIVALRERSVVLDHRLDHAHPALEGHGGPSLTAEILNLSRNVRITGAPQRRAHVQMLHARRPQRVRHVELVHLGPRHDSEETYRGDGGEVRITEPVLGRYALHFHKCHDGSRGSTVEGVVARSCGNHAFVAHESHGVTFRDCVAHDVWESPYWWDPRPDFHSPHPTSHDVSYERCVASLVHADPPFRGFRLAGFTLNEGDGNACIGCVAVGVGGSNDAAGFSWIEGATSVWRFDRCVSHNNARHGIFTWQNSGRRHVVERFTCYRNGGSGISHGAYRNRYCYRDGRCVENDEVPLLLHASSLAGPKGRLELSGLHLDANGGRFAIEGTTHKLPPEAPTLVFECTLTGYSGHAYGYTGGGDEPDLVELQDCRADNRNTHWVGPRAHDDTRVEWS